MVSSNGASVSSPSAFCDSEGRRWELGLTLWLCKAIDQSDYTDTGTAIQPTPAWSCLAGGSEFFAALLQSRPFCWAVIWTIVQPQLPAQLKDLPEADRERAWLSAMNSQAVAAGEAALWEALYDFFHDKATVLRAMREQYVAAQKALAERLTPALRPILERALDEAIEDVQTAGSHASYSAG